MKPLLSILLLASLLYIASAHAAVIEWDKSYMIPKGSDILENLYAAGQQFTLIGNVEGDVLGAGGNVFVNNKISEDAFLLGGTLNIVATVGGDLRLAGFNVVTASVVGGDLSVVGNTIRVVDGTTVAGDAMLAGNNVSISAPVAGNLRISAAEVFINGPVAGNVEVLTNRLRIGPNTRITGSLSYKSVREAVIDPNAVITGATTFTEANINRPSQNTLSFIWSSWLTVNFIALFVSSMILYAIGKEGMTLLSRRARGNPWQNILAGFLFLIGAPISVLLLFMTVIGLPIAFAVIALSIIFVIAAVAFMPILVGTTLKIWMKKNDLVSWKAILLGCVVIMALGSIPVLGIVVRAAIFLMSVGCMIRVALEKLQNVRLISNNRQ